MEPDQIVSALRRHAPLALAHIVLGAIIGLAVALLSPPVYSSHTKALVAADGGMPAQATTTRPGQPTAGTGPTRSPRPPQ